MGRVARSWQLGQRRRSAEVGRALPYRRQSQCHPLRPSARRVADSWKSVSQRLNAAPRTWIDMACRAISGTGRDRWRCRIRHPPTSRRPASRAPSLLAIQEVPEWSAARWPRRPAEQCRRGEIPVKIVQGGSNALQQHSESATMPCLVKPLRDRSRDRPATLVPQDFLLHCREPRAPTDEARVSFL